VFSLLLFNGCNKNPFVMISALAASPLHVRQPIVAAKLRHDFCLRGEFISASTFNFFLICVRGITTGGTSKDEYESRCTF